MNQIRRGHWKETYRIHILNLERFLCSGKGSPLSGEQAVYLAGMIARRLDQVYQTMIQDLLWEDPTAADQLIRKHAPFIGQNAPLVTSSRINAEFLTLEIALGGEHARGSLEISVPARYFGIAAFYAREAGNQTLAELFRFLGNHLPLVLNILEGYLEFLSETGDGSQSELPMAVWERLARETNERNAKKEWWEARGLSPGRKTHIARSEFNRMIDFTGMN